MRAYEGTQKWPGEVWFANTRLVINEGWFAKVWYQHATFQKRGYLTYSPYQEIESNGHEVPLAPRQRMSRTISTLLGPRQREQWWLRDKTSCCNSSPSNTPNFLHKYIYFTSTTPTTQLTTHRQTSCSKGVLDTYYTTVWYNLHTYSKSPNESLLVPLFVLGQTWADWATTFSCPGENTHRQGCMIQ